ncbi:aspartate-semialdehyde dehydrogenase [Flavobacteriales bacterium]|nr:aspartate-semialdehyde dehydrogenase [Flavobacteriales bacterium]
MKVAVIGSTGMVGKVMLEVLQERDFPVSQLIPVSSSKSVGKQVVYNGKEITIVSMEDALASKPDIALFSAGGSVSLEWAPRFAQVGTKVIDNSSAWRMEKALIVPEINGSSLSSEDQIIANPNCSTIQLVMALKPLHDQYKINRIVVSTYQSITGTGVKAVQQLQNEINQEKGEMAYPYPIHENALPHCDVFEENGYTKEEMKLVKETKKILGDNNINITATAVRVPVKGGHSESVNVSFENDFELANVRKLLNDMPGVTVQDNPDVNIYPMPIYAHGKDDVFIGRIRRDFSQPKTLNMWVVADNLRKGAATNAVQIAQYLKTNQLI